MEASFLARSTGGEPYKASVFRATAGASGLITDQTGVGAHVSASSTKIGQNHEIMLNVGSFGRLPGLQSRTWNTIHLMKDANSECYEQYGGAEAQVHLGGLFKTLCVLMRQLRPEEPGQLDCDSFTLMSNNQLQFKAFWHIFAEQKLVNGEYQLERAAVAVSAQVQIELASFFEVMCNLMKLMGNHGGMDCRPLDFGGGLTILSGAEPYFRVEIRNDRLTPRFRLGWASRSSAPGGRSSRW